MNKINELTDLDNLDKALGATYPGQIEDDAIIAKIFITSIVIALIAFLIFSFLYSPTKPETKSADTDHINTQISLKK